MTTTVEIQDNLQHVCGNTTVSASLAAWLSCSAAAAVVLYWFENLTNRPTEKTGLTYKFNACEVDHSFLKEIADSAYTVKSD